MLTSSTGLSTSRAFTLMLVPMKVPETKGANRLPTCYLQPWRPAVPKTMFMLLGSLTKLNKELFSLQQQREHTMPC